MPDAARRTVSASQAAALFELSPYVSRFALYHHFKNGADIEDRGNNRMEWGKFIEPWILRRAAETLNLEVTPNERQQYKRHHHLPLGATKDARVRCPSRGRGVVEAKAVDGWIWRQQWSEDAAPKHIEIQLQAQMLVDGASWGAIACLIGQNDEFIIYERGIMPELWNELARASKQFFQDVADGNEPDPYGMQVELRVLDQLYPESDPDKIITDTDNVELGQMFADYKWANDQAKAMEKMKDGLKPKILNALGDAIRYEAHGAMASNKKVQTKASFVELPDDVRKALRADAEAIAEANPQAAKHLRAAADWKKETRRAGVQNRLTVELTDTSDIEVENTILGAV